MIGRMSHKRFMAYMSEPEKCARGISFHCVNGRWVESKGDLFTVVFPDHRNGTYGYYVSRNKRDGTGDSVDVAREYNFPTLDAALDAAAEVMNNG